MRVVSKTLLPGIAVFGLGSDVFVRPILSRHLDSTPSVGDRATHSHVPLNLALDVDFGDRHDSPRMFTDILLGFGEDPTGENYGWLRDQHSLAQHDPCAVLGWKCAAASNDGGDGQDADGGMDSGYDYDVIGDVLNNTPDNGPSEPFGNGFAYNGPFGGNPPNNGPHGHGSNGPFGGNPPGNNPPNNGPIGPFGSNPPGNNPPNNGPTGPFAGNPPNNDPPIINLADNDPPPGNDPPNNDPPFKFTDNDPPPGGNPSGDDPPGDDPPNNGPFPLGPNTLDVPLQNLILVGDPPPDPVPAPAGFALFGVGLVSAAFLQRRKESPHK